MRTKDYGHKNDTKVVTFCHFLRVKNLSDLFLTIRSYGVVEKVSDVTCHCWEILEVCHKNSFVILQSTQKTMEKRKYKISKLDILINTRSNSDIVN